MMRTRKWLWLVLIAAVVALLGGCGAEMAQDESDLPWAQPQDWESSGPGIGF
jgi:hypothetical protein